MTDINSVLEQARKICINLLELDPPVNADKINDAITKVKGILTDVTGNEGLLFEKLQSVFGISMDEPHILDYESIVPWIKDKQAKHGQDWKFWKRYKDFLIQEKKFPPLIVDRLDDLSDKILDRLGNPDDNFVFDRRGMVVGHVQSGKTSNYIGLMCKAADAGYKLIVVLAGIHSSLRSQTQLRVDEGFLGYDTETSRVFNQANNRIGVGKFDRSAAAHSLTSSSVNGDFKKIIAETINFNLKGRDPVVLVIKKNHSVLENLVTWLAGKVGEEDVTTNGEKVRVIKGISMLVIDDEADNASINISKNSVSSINGSIRSLLNLFNQSAYIGYTATPYANIFINPPKPNELNPGKGIKITVGGQQYAVGDDLFPRNFIINIPPPSNYVGPEKIFGIVSSEQNNSSEEEPDPIPLYKIVRDFQPIDYQDSLTTTEALRYSNSNYIPDKHKKGDTKPAELPESLKTAIKYFILACAGRQARGQENVHNSMLVHVTRFIDWQNHIALKVKEVLSEYKKNIESRNKDFFDTLKEIWEKDLMPVTEKVKKNAQINDPEIVSLTWDQVLPHIYSAASKIQVRAVHGSKNFNELDEENIHPLDYYEHKKGLSVIAVGGNKLSRGLTLEGLSISYYLRSSKMYDTLMQMGRWFGYRPGYLDLCRLFTSEELVSFYRHITAATEEMRAEFDRMYFLKKQPLDFGLKVRTHKGALVITAANKFRYKKIMTFSYSGELEETYRFNRKKTEQFKHNFEITKNLLDLLGNPNGRRNSSQNLKGQKFIWYEENNWKLVVDFISNFQTPQKSFIPDLISDYIIKQVEKKGCLKNWTIAIIDNTIANEKISINENIKVGLSFRKDATKNPDNSLYDPNSEWYEITKAHIIGNFHEYIDLTDMQLAKAIEDTKSDYKSDGKKIKSDIQPSTLRIRTNRKETNALLLIFPLDPKPDKNNEPYSAVPIIGIAISFPYIKDDEKIEYAINKVFDDALFDYPEEFDTEDTYGDEEEETATPTIIRRTMLPNKFLELIENPGWVNLDDTELKSGIVYQKPIDKEIDTNQSNLVLSLNEAKIFNPQKTFSFYESKEIQRYIVPTKNNWVIINPDEESILEKDKVIGLKSSKYVVFAYGEENIFVPDNCWVIYSEKFSSKYLTAIFNSTLFGAWVRINGQRKKERYFITSEVLLSFPLIFPEKHVSEIIIRIVDYIRLTSELQLAESGAIRSYFSDILDAIIFSIYYSESMASTLKTIIENTTTVSLFVETDDKLRKVKEIYNLLYNKDHPVRKEIFFLERQDKVKRIKDVFTDKSED
jgi:hypothetical protein